MARWTKKMPATAIRLAKSGFTLQEIADLLGVSRNVLRLRMKKHGDPEFTEAHGALQHGARLWEPTDVELEQIRKLANIQCDLDEIAAWMGVSPSTIDRRMKDNPAFREAIVAGRKKGSASYKRLLWDHAGDKESRACGKAMGLLGTKFGFGEKHDVTVTVTDYRSKLETMLTPGDDEDNGRDAPETAA